MCVKKQLFFLTLFALCAGISVSCAQNFRGRFLMSFSFNTKENMPPLLWNVDGDKIAIEIQDTMKRRGVTRRILFSAKDSTWTMAMAFNNVKQATRMRTKNMEGKETPLNPKALKPVSGTYTSEHYAVTKLVYDSKECTDSISTISTIAFDLPCYYTMLCHCGLVNQSLRKGRWHTLKKSRGMIIYARSFDKKSGELYTVSISDIKHGDINPSLFSLEGFKISDIPEGQSCGPMVKQ